MNLYYGSGYPSTTLKFRPRTVLTYVHERLLMIPRGEYTLRATVHHLRVTTSSMSVVEESHGRLLPLSVCRSIDYVMFLFVGPSPGITDEKGDYHYLLK